jgi:hypothetical protein
MKNKKMRRKKRKREARRKKETQPLLINPGSTLICICLNA